MARDVDIVLLDALDPLSGGGVFPLGRLREPPESLARADIVIITRDRFSDLGDAMEHALRQWNTRAPVFRATIAPRAWMEHATGATCPSNLPLSTAPRPSAAWAIPNRSAAPCSTWESSLPTGWISTTTTATAPTSSAASRTSSPQTGDRHGDHEEGRREPLRGRGWTT